MKCSEAVEWMNRYLDHDLSETEQKQLLQHLDNCADCSEMFDMLKRVSDQLDNLPDVKPRYSLVDAIMPQLDELDRLEAAEDKSGPAQGNVAPLMRSVRNSRQEDQERISSKRRTRLWARTAGGAAAAIILGFCIYQFQPKQIPNAEPATEKDMTTSSTMDTSDSSSAGTNSGNTVEGSSGSDGGAASPSDSMFSSSGNNNGTALKQPEPTPEPADTKDAKNGSTSSNSPNATASPNPDNGQQSSHASGEKVAPNSAGATAAPGESPSVSPANPEGGSAPASADSSQDPQQLFVADSGADDNAQEPKGEPLEGDKRLDDEMIDPQISRHNEESTIFDITSLLPSNQWVSPDGNYVAMLEDEHLNVYDISSGKQVKIYDDPLKGEWAGGEWAAEGAVFSYSVIQDGVTVSSKVDAKQAAASLQK
ncbi:zf-HC2 domain-containing protein [Paenibacillus caui]|uniref:zf-HC2 domain-containing protein n=1 Tax=Paenibacillus caui TaxID=2873927 RepID=UPI001CA918C5|nr:zf-HC2 domain-containing protein [Paenibacillus caui]